VTVRANPNIRIAVRASVPATPCEWSRRGFSAVRLESRALGPGVDRLSDAGGDAIKLIALPFQEPENILDRAVAQRQVQPASVPSAQGVRRDADGSRKRCDPFFAVESETGLREEVGSLLLFGVFTILSATAGRAQVRPAWAPVSSESAFGAWPAPWQLAASKQRQSRGPKRATPLVPAGW
jgi:hypothetical protein